MIKDVEFGDVMTSDGEYIPETKIPDGSRCEGGENKLYCDDSREILQDMDDDSVHLVVTSPPYNLDIEYGEYDDRNAVEEWKNLIRDVFEELYRVVVPDGKVCINIGGSYETTDDSGRYQRVPLNSHIINIASDIGFDMYDEFVWAKNQFQSHGGGQPLFGSYPYPTNFMATQQHEYVLVFRNWRSESYHDKRELIDRESDCGDISELSKDRWRKITKSIWNIPAVNHSSLETEHNAIFPSEIPKRCIELYSYAGDVVLDPFAGTGTTLHQANDLHRQFVGIDVDPSYINATLRRFEFGSLNAETDAEKRAHMVKSANGTESEMQNSGEQSGLDHF